MDLIQLLDIQDTSIGMVAIGGSGLVWRFMPTDIPSLQNMMPIICEV